MKPFPMERQLTEWEEVLANYSLLRVNVQNTWRTPITQQQKQPNSLIKKWAESLNKSFSQRGHTDVQQAHERHSTSLLGKCKSESQLDVPSCFWTVVLEKTLESPLDCKEIQPVHPRGDQSWVFIGRTDAEAETPVFWPPHAKSWLIGKHPDARRD